MSVFRAENCRGRYVAARTSNPGRETGCYARTFSWANDEGVQIAVREWCAGQGDSKFFARSASSSVVLTYPRNYRS
jgi:hypothetical protein